MPCALLNQKQPYRDTKLSIKYRQEVIKNLQLMQPANIFPKRGFMST